MTFRNTIALACLALAGCDGGDEPSPPAPPIAGTWEAGPNIFPRGNYSAGTALIEAPNGLTVDISQQGQGETHYVTRPMSLAGKSRLVLRGTVEMADDTRLVPVKDGSGKPCNLCGAPSLLTLYFAQRPNDWRTDGQRWWCSGKTIQDVRPGPFEIDCPFDGPWSSIMTMTRENSPAAFANAVVNSDRAGFTLGGGDGLGHGVYSTGPARIVVTSFEALP